MSEVPAGSTLIGPSRPAMCQRGGRPVAREHTPNLDTGCCRRCGTPATPYDQWAEWYDGWMRGSGALANTVALVRRLLTPILDRSMIDLGCGGGLIGRAMMAEGWSVFGVDASIGQLELAASRLTHIRHATAMATGLPDESTGVVISTWTATDIPWVPLLDEAWRLLRPGGTFVAVNADPVRTPALAVDGVRAHIGSRELSYPGMMAPLWGQRWAIREMVRNGGNRLPLLGLRVTKEVQN